MADPINPNDLPIAGTNQSVNQAQGRPVGTTGTNSVVRYTNPPPPPAGGPTSPFVPDASGNPGAGRYAPVPPSMDANGKPILAAVDENTIREQTRQRMQSSIDAINANYADLISKEQNAGVDRAGQTRAQNARSGTIGSDFGTAAAAKTEQYNTQQVKALDNEKAAKIAAVQQNIEDRASQDIQSKRTSNLQEYQINIGEHDKQQAELDKHQATAREDLKQLAENGGSLDSLPVAQRNAILKQAGLDTSLGELLMNSYRTKPEKIDYKAINDNGKILLYGVDPKTGKLKETRVDLNVPEGYTAQYIDGQLYMKDDKTGDLTPAPLDEKMLTPDYKNYLLSKQDGFKGNFESWQNTDANRKRSVSTTINNSGLSQDAISMAAQQYIQTGILPALGNGGAAIKGAILNKAAEMAKANGQDGLAITLNKAAFAADKESLSNLQKNLDATTAFEGTAKKNLDLFLDKAKLAIDTGSPLANKVFRGGARAVTGSDAQAAMDAARVTAFTEIAKVLNNPTSSGVLSDSARTEAEKVLNGDYTLPQLVAAGNVLKQDMNNRRTEYQNQVNVIKGRISGKGDTQAASSGFSVTTPDGQSHSFPDQKSLDSFKQAAGLK